MWSNLLNRSALIVLLSSLVLMNTACSKSEPESTASPTPSTGKTVATPPSPTSGSKPTAQTSPSSNSSPGKTVAVATNTTKPQKIQDPPLPPVDPNAPDNYQEAIDIATGAVAISQSAVSRDDWKLVATQWQEAINLLKKVPSGSKNHKNAQSKLGQYQNLLADAKTRSTPPPPQKPALTDIKPKFFSVPIKGNVGGIPIVEVTFNGKSFDMLFDTGATNTLITLEIATALGLKPIGVQYTKIADGSVVRLPVVNIDKVEVDGRLKRKLKVAVAGPSMPIGLLGHDFYEGYDIYIKDDVIEFRLR